MKTFGELLSECMEERGKRQPKKAPRPVKGEAQIMTLRVTKVAKRGAA